MHKGMCVAMVLLAVSTGCQGGAPPERTVQQVDAEVAEFLDLWQSMANAGDVNGVVEHYADDAVFLDPFGRVHHGKEMIRLYWKEILVRRSEIQIELSAVVSEGDLAAAYGTWTSVYEGAAEGGLWMSVSRYQGDGSLKTKLHQVMVPVPLPGS